MLNLGLALRDLNQLAEAENALRKLLELEPGHVKGWLALAGVYVQTERHSSALGALRRAEADFVATSNQSNDGLLALYTGQARAGLGQQKEALSAFAEAEAAFRAETERFPENRRAWGNLALVIYAQGRREDARAVVDRAIAANPGPAMIAIAREVLSVTGDGEGLQRLEKSADSVPTASSTLPTFESHYMSLARLLQPSMVVIEDVDLIARSRDERRSACDESLLNALLNEMDGLKENSDVLFILTTNRPQDLEAALANRPGRIDQAIEVPVPDAPSRDKLVRLYARGMKPSDKLVAAAVKRTEGVSAAFIKELMRRTAQARIILMRAARQRRLELGRALDALGGRLVPGTPQLAQQELRVVRGVLDEQEPKRRRH